MIVLVFFGAAIAEGSIFTALNWSVVGFAFVVLLLVRPVCGFISLAGYGASPVEKAVISFFGIRGLGSFYYLAFALGKAEFEHTEILWVAVCFVVLASILMHGITVTPVMNFLDRRR
jgi:NhaP-type Na+/H+ or K+/H+ antiporter